jgi:hypothetical protein
MFPMVAFEDAIADFDPVHIVIALRSHHKAPCQERGLLEQVPPDFCGFERFAAEAEAVVAPCSGAAFSCKRRVFGSL